jgi:hypothetical protein
MVMGLMMNSGFMESGLIRMTLKIFNRGVMKFFRQPIGTRAGRERIRVNRKTREYLPIISKPISWMEII